MGVFHDATCHDILPCESMGLSDRISRWGYPTVSVDGVIRPYQLMGLSDRISRWGYPTASVDGVIRPYQSMELSDRISRWGYPTVSAAGVFKKNQFCTSNPSRNSNLSVHCAVGALC